MRPPGDPLGPPFTVNVYQTDIEYPAAVSASTSDFRVFWGTNAGGYLGSYQTRYCNLGTPLSGDTAVPFTYSVTDAAAAPDGRYVIVYSLYDGTRSKVLAQRHAADGSLIGREFEVTDPADAVGVRSLAGHPRVAMNAAGDFVVVWFQGKITGTAGPVCTHGFGVPRNCLGTYQTKIMARRYSGGGLVANAPVTVDTASFATAMVVDLGIEALGPEIGNPAVALANDGSYAVAWTQYTETTTLLRNRQVKLRHYPASGMVPLARTVEDSGTHPQPEVSFDGVGNSVVAFRKYPFAKQAEASLWLRRYSTSSHNALGPAVRVDAGTPLIQQSQVRMASNGNGGIVVAWNSPAGVHFQRYAAGGAPAGGNVTASIGGAQQSPPVIAASGSRFLLGWGEAADIYGLLDVKARLYEGP